MYSLIIQIISSPEDTEELVQDIFLKVFGKLSSFKGDSAFSTWLFMIAYNRAISFTRKRKFEFLYVEENIINNVSDDQVRDLLSPTDNEERIACLISAIFFSLIIACVTLLLLGAYVIVVYLDFHLMNYMPDIQITRLNTDMVSFYSYIAFLVLLLLGIDYWWRQRRRKSERL
ncbi:MAG: hypothetical protein LUH22_20020 [Bacteroides sp.]|nr:hypothetical protein [Bacteroides sp.]